MTRRTDYYLEPDAPAPNSLVPAASVLVTDDHGAILLQRRADNGLWALPGGTMQLGESIATAAVRETKEETGLDVEITGLIGIYTDPRHVIAYPDGEVRQQFNVCFMGRVIGGSLTISGESTAIEFVDVARLDTLEMHPTTRLRIEHYLRHQVPHLA
jgi:ADP-ribose pyrophosphatase YjhB (NUDIX family)